jgi:hypothetical protein
LPALPVGSQPVVLAPLLRVREYLVGLVDLFEALLGLRIVRVDVRMVLASEAPEGALDLLFVGVPADAEGLVVVFIFH